MNTQIGIWLDSDRALLYTLSPGKETSEWIQSEIEHFNLHGGSGSSSPYGAQDAVSERRLLERKKHQQKAYFERIIAAMELPATAAVFGPAEMRNAFGNTLAELDQNQCNVATIQTLDSLTEKQIKAHIRHFFKNQ